MSETITFPPYRLTGREKKNVVLMILPALAEMILSSLFRSVDSIMLGHAPSSAVSLAATGLTGPLSNLVLCVLFAFCVGTTAAVSWAIGAGKTENAAAATRQTLLICAASGTVISLLFAWLSPQLVNFLGPESEDVRQAAIEYYRITSYSFVFQFVTHNVSAALRGAGITKYPMFYNITANGLNVGMNYVLIYGKLGFPAMGVEGAALATTISTAIGMVLALTMLAVLKSPVRLSFRKSFLPRANIMRRVLNVGLTAAAEQLILQSGNVLFTKIIAFRPTVDLSAYSVFNSMNQYIWNVPGACAVASTTHMGMNMGAGRGDRCQAYTKWITGLSVISTCSLAAVVALARKPLCALFIDDPAVIAVATGLTVAGMFSAPGIAVHQTISGSLRAAGDTRAPLVASLISLWVFRVGLGWLLIRVMELPIFWGVVTIAADQIARAAINVILYLRGKWKTKLQPKKTGSR